ncbi:WASH complex subunit 7 [Exaiptasia diaphana]|nr:WASH complex subunit 7 [Exaiptasia diaphana]
MDDTGWHLDAFDDGSLKIVSETQLKKYGKFLEEYANQLHAIEKALDDTVGDTWNLTLDPISLQVLPYEQTKLLELIKTDNKAVTKFYTPLLLYEEAGSETELEEGEAQVKLGRMLSLLQVSEVDTVKEISSFVTRCYEVVKNVLQQLGSLYNKSGPKVIDTSGVHFTTVFEHLGKLLGVLITLDEILEASQTLRDHWKLYRRMVKSVYHNTAMFGVEEEKLRPFEKLLMSLEGQLLDGVILQNCVEQPFEGLHSPVARNPHFAEEFFHNIKIMFQNIEPKLGETSEVDQRQRFVGLLGLYVLHFQIYKGLDKKFFKLIWDVYKKVPAINLVGDIMFFPNEFLLRKIPHLTKSVDKKQMSAVAVSRETYLNNCNQNLSR